MVLLGQQSCLEIKLYLVEADWLSIPMQKWNNAVWKQTYLDCRFCVHWVPNTMISGSLSPRHGVSSGCRWRNGLQYEGELWIYWINSCGQPTRDDHPAWGLGEVITTLHRKNVSCYETFILWKTLTNQNSIQEEIKSRLNSGNTCYYSVQNLLSSSLLPKNLKIKICRTIILLLLCMGVKLGCSLWGRNVGWGCLRIWCWGEYLCPRGTR